MTDSRPRTLAAGASVALLLGAVVDGADHMFNVLTDDQAMAEEVIATTADWFAGKL